MNYETNFPFRAVYTLQFNVTKQCIKCPVLLVVDVLAGPLLIIHILIQRLVISQNIL